MIRMILTFGVLFACFFFGINAVRHMSGKDQLELAKLIAYSTMCSALTVMVLIGFVILF